VIRDGLALRVPRTLAKKPPTRVRILGVAIFSGLTSSLKDVTALAEL